VKIQIRGKGDRTCPYCRDGFALQESATPCLRCGVLIHGECAEELNLCPVMGCGGQFRKPASSRGASSRGNANSGVSYTWVLAIGGVLAFSLLCYYAAQRTDDRKVSLRPRRSAAPEFRTEVWDPSEGPIKLTDLAVVKNRSRTVQITLPKRARRRDELLISAGDVLEGSARKGRTWKPCRMIAAEDATVVGGGPPVTLQVAYVEREYLQAPYQTLVDRIRRARASVSEERVASRVMRLFAAEAGVPWQVRLAAYRIQLHDLERKELLDHLPLEEREVVLQGAHDLLKRTRLLSKRTPHALRGFDPLKDPSRFLPPSRKHLRPYESFRPLRRAQDPRAVEEIAHSYPDLGLTPAQALSLDRLHSERGGPLQFTLAEVLARLESSRTIFERLLWISHVRALDPLLARGLQAAHAEDGLLQAPGPSGSAAHKVTSWKTLVGGSYLSGETPGGTRLQLVDREVSARARILANSLADARLGKPDHFLRLAAHAPRDPRVAQLLEAILREQPSAAQEREAARAAIWLAKASERPDFGALLLLDVEVRIAASDEAAFALDPPHRELLWHALIRADHPPALLLPVFERLIAHGRAAPGDLAAWCALVHEDVEGRDRMLESAGGVEALWTLAADVRSLDPRGRLGLIKTLFAVSENATRTTQRLLGLLHGDEARVEVLDVFAHKYGKSATYLATRLARSESVLWRQKTLRLALEHLEDGPLQVAVKRALRDRSKAVRVTALEGLHAFALQPKFLLELCRGRDLDVARAAWLQLAKSDVRRASLMGRAWAHSREPAKTQLAFDLAKEIRSSRPTLSRQVLEELAVRSHDPDLRRQAAALLKE